MTSWKIFLESWNKIYRQRWRFLIAVSLLHFFSAVAGTFLLSFLLQTFLAWLGYDNLNKDNFGDILMNPLAIGAALIYALVVAFFLLFEFSFLFQLVLASRRRVNFSLRKVVVGAFTEFRAVLNPQIFLLLIYFVAMIPLSNLGLSSFLLEKLYIPKFITEELLKSSFGATVYFGFLLAIFWVNFRLIFLLPLTIINKNSILRNARWSWRLSRKYFTRLFGVGLFYVLLMVMILTIMAIFISVVFGIVNPQISALETMLIFGFVNEAVIFVLAIFSKVFFAEILLCFLLDEEKLPVESRLNYPKQTEIVRARWILAASVVILAGALTWNVWTFYSTKINRQVEIIAHRGETSAAVENSLEALENAKKSGADAMETDVILTRDRKFVVIHDFSLNRLAGRSERVQDLTLAELEKIEISAGEFKSRLVSFEEFAARARKLNMKLFVELKLHGSEPQNYTDLFLAEWEKANLPSGSRVISLNLPALEKIEHKKPEIRTGHIIPFQFGRLNLRTKVDFFVVEDFSFDKNLAKQAHHAGKKIYVWTINEEQIIANYLHSNADGIITDNVQAAIELRTTGK
jgi:glycerophosphoryl diester phosphodiesterase